MSAEGGHRLYPFHASECYTHEKFLRQPGEPTAAQWAYTNPGEKQPLQFRVDVHGEDGGIENVVMEVDGYRRLDVPLTIQHGQTLLCDETGSLRLYDAKGRQVQKLKLERSPPPMAGGPHQIEFSCHFIGDTAPTVQVQFKALGKAESIPGD